MEKTYRILKAVLLVLCIMALLLAGYRLSGSRAQALPETVQTTEAAAEMMPDITVYDAQGNAHKLSDFRGKPVILNFWASWCGPCKSEMPDFQEKYQQYGENIHFLMVNLTDGTHETVEVASEFIAAQGYTFPVYYDTDTDGAAKYGVNAIPVTYFIDGEGGFVTWQQGMLSAEGLQKGIDLLLAE